MQNYIKNLPEPFIGFILMAFGAIILLDAMSIINASVLVLLGALVTLWYGFVLMKGPKTMHGMVQGIAHTISKKR